MSDSAPQHKSAEELKAEGNTQFAAKDFPAAEASYTLAIEQAKETGNTDILRVLYSNRSAARLHLNRPEEALVDAEESLRLDNSVVKAYHRKVGALLELGRVKQAYHTYLEAAQHTTDEQEWLAHKTKETRGLWAVRMVTEPVESSEDFLERYSILTEPRDRLSTMAYFWNASTPAERHRHFRTLLSILSGPGKPIAPILEGIEESSMNALPTENYEDLPPVQPWITFFEALPTEEKTAVMRSMWEMLNDMEKTSVINDVRAFIAQALGGDQAHDGEETKGEGSLEETKELTIA